MRAPLLLVLAAPDGGTASISGGRRTANRVVVTAPDAGTATIAGEQWTADRVVATAPDSGTATITGEWWTADRANRLVVTSTSRYCGGRLSWLLDEADGGVLRDPENPDPQLRSRRLLGLELLSGLKPLGDGTYEGALYDPTDGSTYRGRVTLTGARTHCPVLAQHPAGQETSSQLHPPSTQRWPEAQARPLPHAHAPSALHGSGAPPPAGPPPPPSTLDASTHPPLWHTQSGPHSSSLEHLNARPSTSTGRVSHAMMSADDQPSPHFTRHLRRRTLPCRAPRARSQWQPGPRQAAELPWRRPPRLPCEPGHTRNQPPVRGFHAPCDT